MTQVPSDEERLKDLFKTALVELLEERKDLLRDLIEETLEDIGLARAIEQGQRTEGASRASTQRSLRCSVPSVLGIERHGGHGELPFGCDRRPRGARCFPNAS